MMLCICIHMIGENDRSCFIIIRKSFEPHDIFHVSFNIWKNIRLITLKLLGHKHIR